MAAPEHRDWKGEDGRRWLEHIDRLETMVAPVGDALIARASFEPGETVVDIGCGGGLTSLDIARLVTPGGKVLGVDIAHMLIERAEQRAWEQGVENVEFYCADAENAQLPMTGFDRLFARFGVMFFRDTTAAFSHMRSWLAPGGSIIFSCWAPVEENVWFTDVAQVVSRYITLPEHRPDDPGPFRLSDPDATRAMLERAGYTGIGIESWRGEQPVGGKGASPSAAADFLMTALPIAASVSKLDASVRSDLKGDLETMLKPRYRGGSVMIEGAAWFVTAFNPG